MMNRSKKTIWLICVTFVCALALSRPANIRATGGAIDSTFDHCNAGADDGIGILTAMALQPDGKILIAGVLTKYDGIARPGIARLNSDGSLDTSFDPGSGPGSSNFINAIAVQTDGKIIIGGDFTSYNGTTRGGIARLNSNGSLDVSFDAGLVLGTGSGFLDALAVQPDGKILIGGAFDHVAGIARHDMARLNTNGSLDTSFDSGAGPDLLVKVLALQSDGKILIGGDFKTYNGTARRNIARVLTTGALDTSFDPGTGPDCTSSKCISPGNTTIDAVAIQSDNKILLGGAFDKFNNTSRFALVRVNANGSLDSSFDQGTGLAGFTNPTVAVSNLAVQPDGKIIILGFFRSYNGTPRWNIARVNSTGSLDTSFDTPFPPDTKVIGLNLPLVLQPDGKLLTGRDFHQVHSPLRLITDSATPATIVQFSNQNYTVNEDAGSLAVTVTRSGDLSGTSTFEYFTDPFNDNFFDPCSSTNGGASGRCKYVPARGTLTFAPGESSKNIDVLINNNAWANGDEFVRIYLGNITGAAFRDPVQDSGFETPASAVITIKDKDSAAPSSNPIDATDQDLFVRQHYHDFLNRETDSSGLQFWKQNITSCGSNANCVAVKRIDTSAAFFLSIEFQQTGFYILRIQRVAFGKRSKDPVTRMSLCDWMNDVRQVGSGVVVQQTGWEQVLENNKQAYATQIVNSAGFIARYPTSLTAAPYVDALIATTAVPVIASERQQAITAFGSGGTAGRVAALRSLADLSQLTQSGSETGPNSVVNREFREAFVLMQFYGYLRRNPTDAPDNSDSGYQFWLQKMNDFGGSYVNAEMVKAFISSSEYRQRFGP
jgi:uncharacterized delta-60 repeat protein